MKDHLRRIILCISAGTALAFSFPNFNLSLLAWIGLVPLFFAVEKAKTFQVFLLSYLCGIIFFAITVYWIAYVSFIGLIILILYLALYFAVFGLVLSRFLKLFSANRWLIFTIPALWVCFEFLRTNFSTGFGWVLLGYSQWQNLPIIQIADITGVYGVSFTIVMVNFACYGLIKNVTGSRPAKIQSSNLRLFQGIATLSVIAIFFGYGYLRLRDPGTDRKVVISAVQGNIDQEKKWDERYREDILNSYIELTRAAAADNPDLIIWPEAAVPGFLQADLDLYKRVTFLAIDIDKPLLIGTPAMGENNQTYNRAVMISRQGKISGSYDKMRLVPFGEYLPFPKLFRFAQNLSRKPIGDFTSGKEYAVFALKDQGDLQQKAKLGTLICFENLFPGLARKFVRKGADIMTVITNDAWFGRSSAPFQHAYVSIFRAVENRVSFAHIANTGLSCFIAPNGKIKDFIRGSSAKDIFIQGYKTVGLPLSNNKSPYVLFGDLFAYICIFVSLISIYGCNRMLKNANL